MGSGHGTPPRKRLMSDRIEDDDDDDHEYRATTSTSATSAGSSSSQPRKNEGSSDSEADRAPKKAKKAAATPSSGAPSSGDSGSEAVFERSNAFLPQLSNTRRVTVSKFRRAVLVDIREYYTDNNNQLKPGKKGISLNLDQWAALKRAQGDIDAAIARIKG